MKNKVFFFQTMIVMIFCLGAFNSAYTQQVQQIPQQPIPPPQPIKPDLIIVKVTNFRLRTDWKKVQFDLEIKNIGTGSANLTGCSVQSYLSKDGIMGDDILAGFLGIKQSESSPLLQGQTRVLTDLWFAYNNVPLVQYPYVVIQIDNGNSVSELNENNNKKIVKHGFPLQPDLRLYVTNVTSSIETNAQTGVVFKEYRFKCTVTNVGQGTAFLSDTSRIVIQSYRVNTCSGVSIGGAGGRIVGQNLTQILPGETVVFENQSANQPPDSTSKIRVELKYALDPNLSNNTFCIEN